MKPFNLVALFVLLCIVITWTAAGRTVTDEVGRVINVPDNPSRVVALAPSVTEMVFEIGKGDLLVGVTRFSDYPEEANRLPKVGSYVHLDLEKIVALKPDLCIGIKDGNALSVVKRLEQFKIPVYAINPRNLDSVMVSIRNVGDLLNEVEKSVGLTEKMMQRIDTVKKRLRSSRERPGVFFQIGINPIVSAGTQTFIHDLITSAGGNNLASGPTPYPRFSREQVLRLKPDLIIVTSMDRGDMSEQEQEKWRQWTELPAARSNQIVLVDSNLFDRPSPRLVTGLEILARVIHPDLFPVHKK